MPFTYDYALKGDYMLVITSGTPNSAEEFFEYIKTSVRKALDNGITTMLFDETQATMKFTVYDKVLMSDLLDLEGLQNLQFRVAVICRHHDLAACKYFESSLRDRAFNVMMFDDIEDGKRWLLTGI